MMIRMNEIFFVISIVSSGYHQSKGCRDIRHITLPQIVHHIFIGGEVRHSLRLSLLLCDYLVYGVEQSTLRERIRDYPVSCVADRTNSEDNLTSHTRFMLLMSL